MSIRIPEPKPFSPEFDRLYDEYVRSGAKVSWDAWLCTHTPPAQDRSDR